MQRIALVTGGSGFLGSYVVRDLLAEGFDRIIILMRGDDVDECEQRLRALWWERPELASEIGKRIQIACGNITCEQLGLEDDRYRELASNVTHIIHAAAEIGVNQTAERFAEANVEGTLNVLLFAEMAHREGNLKRLVHVSTAYVAGMRNGIIHESELVNAGFNSLYEQSKFGAEQLVRDVSPRIPASIVRPAQIVGDSETGFAATFNTLYYPLKLYLKGELPVIPVSADQKNNMIPVDFVSRIVVSALVEPSAVGKTFHAVIPADQQPTAGELLAFVRAWAIRELHFDPGNARCIPLSFASAVGRTRNLAKSSTPKRKSLMQNMLALAPYFAENRTYDAANTEALLAEPASSPITSWDGFLVEPSEPARFDHVPFDATATMTAKSSSQAPR